ncbi:MAG: helix-turn-helix transcriptional regulator [Deltaproteobacteria bacterium]|nr:helix-turn-helix transcriptional regulator [Deltaproteobacteria bacterium]MBW2306715.1 helix-turn-helix transcriptional regulator [Deltaproteobacteria bacterium]
MDIERMIGSQVRDFRKARRLKLEELAQAAGISKALLSKIENARVSSPISTYIKIAKALGVSIGDLIRGGQDVGCVIVRKDEGKLSSKKLTSHGYQFESLGYKWPNKKYHPFLLTYLPQTENAPLPNFVFDGEEFIFLLEGDMEMIYGEERYRLAPGDCIFLNGNVPHGGRALGDKKAVALLISVPS